MGAGWRIAAWALRAFAFGLLVLLGLLVYQAPSLRESLGPDSWWASLLPIGPLRIVVWVGAATLNAGAALFLAAYLESS